MKKTMIFAWLMLISATGIKMNAQVTVGSDVFPQTTLDIIGDTANIHGEAFRLIDGNQGAGKVLTSDANGVGTWQPLALPMIMGAVTGSNQTISMADYLVAGNVSDFAEVPFASYTLPPGRWMLFSFVPIQFKFTDTSIAQVSFGMGFAPEDNSSWGTASLTQFIHGTIANGVLYRDLTMGIVDNTTNGDVTYTLRIGKFHVLNISGEGIAPSGNITIIPTGMSAILYAIKIQ